MQMMRFFTILGIIGIVVGTIITIASAVMPDFGKVLASPFCDEVEEGSFGMTLTCVRGEDEIDLTMAFTMGGTFVIIGASLLLVFGIVGGLMAMSAKLDRIVKYGEPAQGLILDMQHTGVRVNSQPMIKFRLRVTPSYDPPYEAETSRIVPFGMMGRLAIGMSIPIKYDPKKPEDVALDFQSMQIAPIAFGAVPQMYGQVATMGAVAPQQDSLADRLRELEETYKAGLITQQEYETARQKIISGI
jgi:hypothetical protein